MPNIIFAAIMPKHACYIFLLLLIFISQNIVNVAGQNGILYPQESETRDTRSLDGIWNFRIAPRTNPNLGFEERWFDSPLEQTGDVELMPVPSSYNDITQSRAIRDHIGYVWYDRQFWAPRGWNDGRRIFIRFGSVNYDATVFINGQEVVRHSGGHLPFQVQLQELSFTGPNRITVAVNNTLTADTVPQGFVSHKTDPQYPPGFFIMTDNFDFFKYAGIHRPVVLYSVPQNYIDDITAKTEVTSGTTGLVFYEIATVATGAQTISVILVDKDDLIVAQASGVSGALTVTNAKLWWPYTMVDKDSDAGYLYTFVVTLTVDGATQDVYRTKVGIRSVRWSSTDFLINDRSFYFRGFGRHEDSNIRGRGFDPVLNVKDHNLLKWIGANSYRTSHYPYSEEILDLTDRLGIVIINECSAVSLTEFGPGLLATHREDMRQLIQRDKNRASVVMWSVANEPRSEVAQAENYFRDIIAYSRTLDETRPITVVLFTNYANDKAAQFADIICLNRYHNWYTEQGLVGMLDGTVEHLARTESLNWINTYGKPLIYSEYGADTVAGLHMSPSYIFTEEFQTEYLREHFRAFDFLRGNTSFIGEMIWNFADFMTKQEITRVVGNRKGVFTRDRQPKDSAHLLRSRYFHLANEASSYPVPNDLHTLTPVYALSKCEVGEHVDSCPLM